MKFSVGDVVDFTDSTSGFVYRGVIIDHVPGRDKRGEGSNRPLREYLMKFDNLWYGYDRGWVAGEELTMVRSGKTSPTVTYTSSTWTNKPLNDKENIKVTPSHTLNKSTVSQGNAGDNGSGSNDIPDYPWTPFYMTTDEFFDILKVAFDDTYGNKSSRRWHPEDLYINVSCVLEVVSNTLANAARLRSGKDPAGVKDI